MLQNLLRVIIGQRNLTFITCSIFTCFASELKCSNLFLHLLQANNLEYLKKKKVLIKLIANYCVQHGDPKSKINMMMAGPWFNNIEHTNNGVDQGNSTGVHYMEQLRVTVVFVHAVIGVR